MTSGLPNKLQQNRRSRSNKMKMKIKLSLMLRRNLSRRSTLNVSYRSISRILYSWKERSSISGAMCWWPTPNHWWLCTMKDTWDSHWETMIQLFSPARKAKSSIWPMLLFRRNTPISRRKRKRQSGQCLSSSLTVRPNMARPLKSSRLSTSKSRRSYLLHSLLLLVSFTIWTDALSFLAAIY